MSVSSYNANPALNTAISGIDISEGCPAGSLNDALRQIMADIRAWTDAYAITYPMSIANGGTGQTAAQAAFNALAAAGGAIGGPTTINANLTRLGKGVHPYWGSTSATGGQMYLQAMGSDPTNNPYDVVYEY